MRPERRLGGRDGREVGLPPPAPIEAEPWCSGVWGRSPQLRSNQLFWRESGKSQGFGGGAPNGNQIGSALRLYFRCLYGRLATGADAQFPLVEYAQCIRAEPERPQSLADVGR